MLDRLISGAGAVTDAADRSVRLLASGSSRGIGTTRPGSVAVAAILLVLASLLVLAGLEATDARTPEAFDPTDVAIARDLGNRTYATLSGAVHAAWVETYDDVNGNGVEDADENVYSWYYWLVDRADRSGVTVRSKRPPSELFTFSDRGYVLSGEPRFLTSDRSDLEAEAKAAGLTYDSKIVIDTVRRAPATAKPFDLAGAIPAGSDPVVVSGSRLGSWVGVCARLRADDNVCDPSEEDQYEILVFEPVSRHAVRVLVAEPPEFSDATITGLLRREERAVDHARNIVGLDFDDYDLDVSDLYILEDGLGPKSAPLAFVAAAVLVILAGIIIVGLAGGYLIYRKGGSGLPLPATTLAPGERLALRISGLVRTPSGLEHVREVPGELTRFVLGQRVPIATTLLVERVGFPQGVALGLGELVRISSGEVMALRGSRPALRVVAGTGPLLLSFDDEAERDRAAAELLDESGLGRDGTHISTP
jgi:hypothetical protein